MRSRGAAGERKVTATAEHWSMVLAVLVLASALGCTPASAFLARPVIFAAIGSATKAPHGWLQFCADSPDECRPAAAGGQPSEITLTPELLEQLYTINHYANDRVTWTPDRELYGEDEHWAYPLDRGDCEDIVLLKRQLLAKAGWPIAALLITVVEDRATNPERHAVLTVRTDRGEMILDNLTPEILFWYETSYHFLSRQSPADPNIWVSFSTDQPHPAGIAAVR
jgi:predicted transglutaminase-like cysteine proteinase